MGVMHGLVLALGVEIRLILACKHKAKTIHTCFFQKLSSKPTQRCGVTHSTKQKTSDTCFRSKTMSKCKKWSKHAS